MISDLGMLVGMLVLIVGSTGVGIRVGRRAKQRPENEHLGTIQGGLLGLLALLLGFAFAGAMSRFIERQDALAREANSIENAYMRAGMLPRPERLQTILKDYAKLRLELFREARPARARELEGQLQRAYAAAFAQAVEGVRENPQLTMLLVPGVEAVNDEFSARGALEHRHLPAEFLTVLLLCSCVSMATAGYGVGIAERRSVGSAMALAALVAIALYTMMDFDRPRRGLVRLNPAPLVEVVQRLSGPS